MGYTTPVLFGEPSRIPWHDTQKRGGAWRFQEVRGGGEGQALSFPRLKMENSSESEERRKGEWNEMNG